MAATLALVVPGVAGEAPALRIDGGTNEQRKNIQAFIPMTRYECELPGFREPGIRRTAEDRSRQALRALGHYQPTLNISIARTETCWDLVIEVDPGPEARFSAVDIRVTGAGETDPAFIAVVSDPGIAPGDPLRHDAHDHLRSRLLRVANDRGYLDAELTESRLQVDPESGEAQISMHLDSGPRYQFGPIRLVQDILRDDFVARLFPFEPGEPYSSRQLIQLQRNLGDSGYFESVRVRPLLDQRQDGEIPILVEAEPRKRTAYEIRLGYSTDIGPRLGALVERRYANRRGHRYNAEIEWSEKRSSAGFGYSIPLADPRHDSLKLSATHVTEDTGTSQSRRFQSGANWIQRHDSGWTANRGIRYEYEDFTVGEVSDISRLLVMSYRVTRTVTDDPVYPRDGHRIDLLAQGASETLASSFSFAQARGSTKFIRGLGTGRLILRGDAGATGGASIEELPSSLRFFAGGDSSVRGFGFQQLGPTDNAGNVIGGRHVLVGSIEYDHPIGQGNWGAAVFLDAGNAFNNFDDYELKGGAGVGIRWRSPIGPLRFDLAHAPDSKDSFRIHFTMGPDL